MRPLSAARHRAPDPAGTRGPADELDHPRMLRALTFVVVVANGAVGAALMVADPGASPALRFIESLYLPLPAWGALPVTAAALLAVRRYIIGHTLALFLWLLLAIGAVYGLVSATTTSPAGSLILTALVGVMVGFHAIALGFRRQASTRSRGSKCGPGPDTHDP